MEFIPKLMAIIVLLVYVSMGTYMQLYVMKDERMRRKILKNFALIRKRIWDKNYEDRRFLLRVYITLRKTYLPILLEYRNQKSFSNRVALLTMHFFSVTRNGKHVVFYAG